MCHIYQNRVQTNKILTNRLCLAAEPYFQGICSLEPPFQVFSYLFQILESCKLYGSVFNAIIWLKTIRLSSNNVLIFYIIFILINVVPLVPRRDWPISYQFLSQASGSFTAYISHYLLQKMMQKIPEKRPLVPRRDWLIRDLLSFPQEASVSSDDSAKKQSSQKETVCFDSLRCCRI